MLGGCNSWPLSLRNVYAFVTEIAIYFAWFRAHLVKTNCATLLATRSQLLVSSSHTDMMIVAATACARILNPEIFNILFMRDSLSDLMDEDRQPQKHNKNELYFYSSSSSSTHTNTHHHNHQHLTHSDYLDKVKVGSVVFLSGSFLSLSLVPCHSPPHCLIPFRYFSSIGDSSSLIFSVKGYDYYFLAVGLHTQRALIDNNIRDFNRNRRVVILRSAEIISPEPIRRILFTRWKMFT